MYHMSNLIKNTNIIKGMICSMVSVAMLLWPNSVVFSEETEVSGEELMFKKVPLVKIASEEEEKLTETPIVTTVVTEEEIKRIGARTLSDVLAVIPGFSHAQDHNEWFMCERGIYASSQQKILILRDGHRLNCRSYSEANTDYAISLANVKAIEIMRGPGASLYGDVALTAVINLVSKQPKDIDGVEVTLGGGNFGQGKADIVAGGEFAKDKSFSFFASLYRSDGQKLPAKDPIYNKQGEIIQYGFKDPISYDIGGRIFVGKNLQLFAEKRDCHYIEPYSAGGKTGEVYNYDDYLKFNNMVGPGLRSIFTHAGLEHSLDLGNKSELKTEVYYDNFRLDAHLIADPSQKKSQLLQWDDYATGLKSIFSKKYSGLLGEGGSLLAGFHFDYIEITQSELTVQTNGQLSLVSKPPLDPGVEHNYALFAQVKHKFTPEIIANVGARYDYRKVKKDLYGQNLDIKDVDNLSPRAALIFLPTDRLSLKLSYAHSFVVAPYWYRYNSFPSYQGAYTLKPEQLDTYQFTLTTMHLKRKNLTNQINLFLNNFRDVIVRTAAPYGQQQYDNAGKLNSYGVEYELGWGIENLNIKANYTYQCFTEVKGVGMASKDGKFENVPQHMANLIVDFAPLYNTSDFGKKLWLNLTMNYIGEQFARWGKTLTNPDDVVDAVLVTNLTLTINDLLAKGVSLSFSGYNIFDTEYYQGGSVLFPIRQPGRFLLGSISYKF
jgi:iron complex outermembrane receptor protein